MKHFYNIFIFTVLLSVSLPLEAKYTPAPVPVKKEVRQRHVATHSYKKQRIKKAVTLHQAKGLCRHKKINTLKDGIAILVLILLILMAVLLLGGIGFLVGFILSAIAGAVLGMILYGFFALLFLGFFLYIILKIKFH